MDVGLASALEMINMENNIFGNGDFMVPNHPEVIALRKREKRNAYMRTYNKTPKGSAYKKAYWLSGEENRRKIIEDKKLSIRRLK